MSAGAAHADPCFVVGAVECVASACAQQSDGCRYQIKWQINPHMQVGGACFERAGAQHADFTRLLASNGGRVIDLPFVHDAYDSPFVKDAALLFERGPRRRAFMAHPQHDVRRRERRARAEQLLQLGFEVFDDSPYSWEGGDVLYVRDADVLLLGVGLRTDPRAAAWLEDRTKKRVIPIELRDPHLFHLDLALTLLPDGAALVCEEAFAEGALDALPIDRKSVHRLSRKDALDFGLNVVPIGDAVVTGSESPALAQVLDARGVRRLFTPLTEFHLAGGSASCLVAPVHVEAEAFLC